MNDLIKAPVLDREIATTADGIDITRGYTGPLLYPYDSVLRNRGNYDLQIYEQVFSDSEVQATFTQRQSALVQCEWRVDAGGDRRIDKKAAAWMQQQLQKLRWDNTTQKMHYGLFYGYGVAELIYGRDGDKIGISAIKVRNRRRFRYGKEGDLRLLTHASMFEGIPCERPYFWDFCCGADNDDEPYGLGLAHHLYWPVLFKRNGIKFWLIFLEKFGMPTVVGSYDENATDGEKVALLQAARAFQVDSGIIKPKSMDLVLEEASRSGTADYRALHDAMNASIQKTTLGQTASTQGTPGKLGNEDLQGDVRGDLVKADADLICESFNQQIIPQLMAWNFPDAELPRVWRVTEADEDLNTRAERDDKIHTWGFKPTLAYVHETYGGEWVEKSPAAPGPDDPDDPDTPGRADPPLPPGAQFAEGAGQATPAAAIANQLDTLAQPGVVGWVDQLATMADTATTLEELRAMIVAAYDDLPEDQVAIALAEAMQAAQAAGRFDASAQSDG